MTRIVTRLLRTLGLVAIPAPSWSDFERRFAEIEADRGRLAQTVSAVHGALAAACVAVADDDLAKTLRTLHAGWMNQIQQQQQQLLDREAAHHQTLLQLQAVNDQIADSDRVLTELGRLEALVAALSVERDRLEARLDEANRRLAEHDSSGLSEELKENKNELLRRIADLEQYLFQTRGDGTSVYL